MTRARTLHYREVVIPLAGAFRISRGAKHEARLVRVEVSDGRARGLGECCPYPRYGESVESVASQIENVRAGVAAGMGRQNIQSLLPPGAARNALDCALWDLEAKQTGVAVPERLGMAIPGAFPTMRTVVINTPAAMAREAASYPKGATLKVKLDMERVAERLKAIRTSAPDSPIVVDANEGWTPDFLGTMLPRLKALGVVLLEQPLPAGQDQALETIGRPVPVCADEACHTSADLPRLAGRYDAVNVKLDKTGGLSEAVGLIREARARGFGIMLGCMVSSSLSIAPIAHLCSHADYIDLDGPLLLKRGFDDGMVAVPGSPEVELRTTWGRP